LALPWVEARVGFALAESQRSAVKLALVSKVLVITSGPALARPPSSKQYCESSPQRE
jgi:exodeoxyribonuclease V alpha subunit